MRSQYQIDARLAKITLEGHFGTINQFRILKKER